MAQIKVSELTALTNTDGAEEVLINDGGTSKKVTIANLLHDNSIDSKHYIDGSIDTAHLANNSITSAKLGVDVIVAEDIAANAITVSELQANAVTTVKILDANVTYAKIQNVSATNRILGRDSASAGVVEEITPANLRTMINVEDGATADQTAAQIKTALENGIDSVHYVNASIDNEHLAANSVDSDNYVDASIDLAHMSSESVDEDNLYISNAGSNGQFLSKQSGNDGGMTWAAVDALPSQTSNSGKFLTTNGSAASWAVLNTDSNSTTKGLYEMANVISANYVIGNNNNAMSAGPITINSNISVTVPSGSTWVIA